MTAFQVQIAGQTVPIRFQTVSFAGIRDIVSADVAQDIAARAAKAANLSDLVSASEARTNLGATATGAALFTSADAAAARTAISAASTDLSNVVYATVTGETGVINAQYQPGDVRRYGVFPDGTTNWEADYAARMTAIYANAALGIPIVWARHEAMIQSDGVCLYKTAINLDNTMNGSDGQFLNFIFEPGVEIGGLCHFISSATAISDGNVSAMTVGTTTTLTFAAAHGMTIGQARYVDITGTSTTLDGSRRLLTPTTTTQATVAFDTTGQSYVSGGLVNDSSFRLNWTGWLTTYNRLGTINWEGTGEWVWQRNNSARNPEALSGAGSHFYFRAPTSKIMLTGGIIVENTGTQASTSANLHGGVAIDGGGDNGPRFSCPYIWVQDAGVNGVVASGRGIDIGFIEVDAWGNGSATSQLPDFGVEDAFLLDSANTFSAVLLGRGSGTIGHIRSQQKNGISGRSDQYADVTIDRDFLDWTDFPSTFTETKMGWHIGHIESPAPYWMVLASGAFQSASSTNTIDKISIGVVPDANVMQANDALRLERGLIWHSYGDVKIGHISVGNAKRCTVFSCPSNSHALATYDIDLITVHDHAGRVTVQQRPGNIGKIDIKQRSTSGAAITEHSILVSTTGANGGPSIGSVQARNPNAINAPLIDWNSNYGGKLSNVFADGYQYTGAEGTIEVRGSYTTIENVVLQKDGGPVAGTAGIRLNAGQDVRIIGARISQFAKGVAAVNTPARLHAIACVATGNTVDSDFPTASLATNQGNSGWSV